MLRMVGLKLAYLVPVMFVVSLATFFILEAVPGDPAVTVAGVNADPAIVAEIRAELGLDQPVIQRYFDWLGGVLTGDLGRQLLTPRLPVSTVRSATRAMAGRRSTDRRRRARSRASSSSKSNGLTR